MDKKDKWVVAQASENDIQALGRGLGISPLAARVLCARGINTPEKAQAFLCTDLSGISDPFLLADMDKAVEAIEEAIARGDRMAVYGDYDVDGITATAILVRYLTARGADCRYYIPDRINEGYGLNLCAIDKLWEDGCRLLITVDSGITAIEEIDHARGLGMKVVITDHHECGEELPRADAVVNPRRSDSAYPFRELAGVGVAFKLICAMEKGTSIESLLAAYADMVSLGTIADVMPMVGENRIIVSHGLKNMKNTDNVGLKALVQKLGLDTKPITANSVSFVLAPRINAAGRLGEAECTVRLMLTEDCGEACRLADYLCELNRRRQEEENDIYCRIVGEIDKDPSLADGKIMVLWGEGWHTGVIGIVSSRLAEKYGKPCVLVSVCGESGKGSGRSIKGFNLHCALCYAADLLERYGGHELAVGLTVSRENLPKLRSRLEEYAEKYCLEEEIENNLDIDCVIAPGELTCAAVKGLSVLEPFGMGNPMPLFMITDAVILEITPISHERHVKLLLEKDGHRVYGFVFGMGSRCCPFVVGDKVDAAFSAEINYFRGTESVQLVIKDIRWSQTVVDCDRALKEYYIAASSGGEIDKEHALCLCPCRDDLVAVFRHVKTNQEDGLLCGTPRSLYRKIKYESKCCMNLGRFLVCMDILKEFDIFDYERAGENIIIRDLNYKGKVDINGSKIIKKFMDVIKG